MTTPEAIPYHGQVKRFLLASLLTFLSATAAAQPGGGDAPAPGGGAGGADPEQLLGQAEKLYEALEYEASLKLLIAVQQTPSSTPMQKARSFLYMGVCFTALGNAENAVASFMELLKIKAGFRLPPGVSPSIQAMFKEALKRMKLPETAPPEGPGGGEGGGGEGGGGEAAAKDSGVSVEATVSGSPKAGQPVEVTIELTDPKGLVRELQLRWRLVGGADYSTIKVPHKAGEKRIKGRIPGAVLGQSAGRLQYLVEALGQGGLVLGHAGTESSPLESELTASRKPGTRWGWYLLGIGGGAAIVGGIVAAVLLTRGSGAPPLPTTANVSVTIH